MGMGRRDKSAKKFVLVGCRGSKELCSSLNSWEYVSSAATDIFFQSIQSNLSHCGVCVFVCVSLYESETEISAIKVTNFNIYQYMCVWEYICISRMRGGVYRNLSPGASERGRVFYGSKYNFTDLYGFCIMRNYVFSRICLNLLCSSHPIRFSACPPVVRMHILNFLLPQAFWIADTYIY